MLGVEDGFLVGAAFNNAPAIALRGSDMDTVWTKSLGTSWGQVSAFLRDGDDFYGSGYSSNTGQVWKFNASGDTAWSIAVPHSTFTNLSSMAKLSDGNFVAGGNLDDYPLVVKFSSSGDTVWTYTENIFISFQRSSIYEKANGEIVLIARDRAIVLNASGEKQAEINFSNDCFDLAIDGDNCLLVGSRTSGNFGNDRMPYIEIRNENMDSLGMWEYSDFIHPPASNGLESVVATPTGGFIAAGKIRDSIEVLNNTYNVFAVRFNDDLIGGLEPIDELSQLSLYPNPTDGRLVITCDAPIGSFEVVDLQGRVILSDHAFGSKTVVDLSDLTRGYYVVKTKSGATPFLKQ